MVGEHAVGLEKLAAGDVRTQGSQHVGGVEAPGPVARVHHDVEALEGVVIVPGVYTFFDDVPKGGGVGGHVVHRLPAAGELLGRGQALVRTL